MKALTVWQPWASLLVLPLDHCRRPKTFETRPWDTRYRGPLAIHAAKTEPAWVRDAWMSEPRLRSVLTTYLTEWASPPEVIFDELPRGAIVGRLTLDAVLPASCNPPDPMDALLGDFSPGQYAWSTSHPHRLVIPVPYRGSQGLWGIPDDLLVGQEWEACDS